MANYESTLISNEFKTKNNEEVLKVLLDLGLEETYITSNEKVSIASYGQSMDDSMNVIIDKETEKAVTAYTDYTYENLDPEILKTLEDENINKYKEVSIYDYLKDMLLEGETIQIKETGNEKLRYNGAYGLVITQKSYQWFNLDDIMEKYAEENK